MAYFDAFQPLFTLKKRVFNYFLTFQYNLLGL
ncbi:hypothetical protein FAES_1275 [Fibrella aestuarina BUZ 2]|uniref:Uncharacterized protein n=1 Tax=Fibrella aestuarina BUZ 2 TaxID=1166018 RepID=I0K582_9BACT|nr:hypothetical protein FAES_1275 [Fibrella aestuarina BUZ 2]